MKWFARNLLGAIGCASFLQVCFPTAGISQPVKVMHWNVHGNLGTAAAQASAGAAAIGRVLNHLQPDVLLLNEVADGDAVTNTVALTQWVGANLPYLAVGSFSVSVSTESSSIQRNAVVSRYPVLNPFTYPDVSSGLRGLFSFDLQLAGTNRLHVFYVHLKCCGDAASCQTKQDEAQLFTNNIATWAATNSTPYLFVGDLNEDEASPECPSFPTIQTLRDGAQLGEFKPTTLSGEYRTWSTAGTPTIRFDYILAATNRLTPTSGFVFNTMDWAAHGLYTNANPSNLASDSQTASDHYAVVANYNFATNLPAALQTIQTVFVIPMENQNWSSVRGSSSAPYINNTLLPMGAHAEQYFNPPGQHPSLPNYLWLEAGTNFGIAADPLPATAHQNTTNHFVTLLKNAGLSWRSYNEDICGCNCPLVNTNLYVSRHNPFVYFDDVTNTNSTSSGSCMSNVRAFSQLAGDLGSNTVARYNWVVPNLCDDMHNTSPCATTDPITNGDSWLANNLPAILTSPAYTNNGAVFIVWDEGAGTSDGPIGLIVLSPLAKVGYSNTVHYTHSATLRTMQEIFDAGPLLGDAAHSTNLSDLFNLAGQLSVSPASGFAPSGPAGGPFNPTNQTYSLSNSGLAAFNWTAGVSSNWLTPSATSGTLAPGTGTTVTISLNSNAGGLAGGNYSATLSFSNTTSGAGSTSRPVSLTVNNASPQLTVGPASGLNSSGPVGGSFSPGNQTYTLNNSGGAALDWTASRTANWLTLSATNGTLAAGAGTNISVSINSNANALAAGGYADTVAFTNTSNGAGNTTRAVSLTVTNPVAQLAVGPVAGLTSGGPVGGSFTPASQNYTLSNPGGLAAAWSANKSSNWLTLSATSGTLVPGASTNVTVSINASANTLAAGSYSDLVAFTNTTSGLGNTSRNVNLTVSSFGFFDDFSAFAAGNLVGQQGWIQLPSSSTLPLQASGGQVVIPFGQSGDNQDAYKNFTATNGTVFFGLTLTVTNAPASATPSYFAALYTSNNAAGFANYRLSARDNGGGACVLAARITAQTGDPYTFGATGLSYGTQRRVIVEADGGGTVMKVFVDPTSANLAAQTVYASNYIGTGTAPLQVGSFVISQFVNGSAPNVGALIGKVVVSDNFGSAYTALLSATPPVANFSGTPTGGTELLSVNFTDTSTGTFTNRFWDFGDASTTNTSVTSVNHAYAAGAYNVTLVVSGPGGSSTSVQTNYIVVLTAFQGWQVKYFGSTTNPAAAASFDPDGDGQSNLAEFWAGTNPTNGASVFRITGVTREGEAIRLTWSTAGGRTNVIQTAVAVGGPYSNRSPNIVIAGSGDAVTNYLDASALNRAASRYYRVQQMP